jgi:alkylation response protein AidB-like acyl-CoA dehydrogenase
VSGDLLLEPPVLPAAVEELRAEVRAFLAEQRAAGAFEPRCDSWLAGHSPAFSRALGERGWLGMTWPEEYGGHGRSAFERFTVVEELLAAGAPVAAHWIADRQMGPGLLRHGTPEQCARLLPPIARGESYWAIGMSEPDSGSDLASARTAATRDGDGWRVRGTKLWTSWAHESHYLMTLCRTGPAGPSRHEGLSQLVIDLSSPGVDVRPVVSLDGEHHFNEVVLDDVFVPGDMLLGQEGNGWRQVTGELAYERSGPERFLSTFPMVAAVAQLEGRAGEEAAPRLGALLAQVWSVRQLSLAVAASLDAGRVPMVEAALVKDVGTTFEQASVDAVRRLLPPGSPGHELVEQALSRSPGFTLRGGTTEILRGVIAGGLGL